MFAGATCIIIYRLAIEWFNRDAAILSVILFASFPTVVDAATGARAYAFGIFCVSASVLALNGWLNTGLKRPQVMYVLFAALTIYAHPLFSLIFGVHFLLATCRDDSITPRYVTLQNVLGAQLIALVLASVNCVQLLKLYDRGKILIYAPEPEVLDLFYALMPPQIMWTIIGSSVIASACARAWPSLQRIPFSNQNIALAIWWIGPALLLFVISKSSGSSLFIDRYYAWAMPAAALAIAMLASSILHVKALRIVPSVVGMFVLISNARQPAEIEDWREAAKVLQSLVRNGEGVVFAYTGLIESQCLDWVKDDLKSSYLLSPLAYYSVPVDSVILPSTLGGVAEAYFKDKMNYALHSSDTVYLISRMVLVPGEHGIQRSNEYLKAAFEGLQLRQVCNYEYDRVFVKCFKRI